MPTIALVGGNSQVATEVALFLSTMPDVQVVPVCRSALASSFLRHCGLSCRIGRMDNPEAAREVLAGADLVADFSLPLGTAREIRHRLAANMTNLARESPPGCRIVYISTQMALGVAQNATDRRYHLLSRTTYGATKRYGEKLAQTLARSAGKQGYVLRLGSVHGELQGVSSQMRATFARDSRVALPDTVSDTVFAFTIAEALANIAAGREKPGVYTLMSTPDWHWLDMYEYFCERAGTRPELHLYSCAPAHAASRWLRSAQTMVRKALLRNRETIGAYLLWRFPKMENRMFAKYRVSNVARDAAAIGTVAPNPHCGPVVGPIAGRRLTSLTDSRVTMRDPAKRVRSILARASASLDSATPAHKAHAPEALPPGERI